MTLESLYKSRFLLSWNKNKWFLFVFLLFTLSLVYRRADAFTNPQFWAEDGMVFFVEQDHHSNFIAFQNYNGYIHFIPRLVAYKAKLIQLPLEYVPAFYNYATYLIYLFYFLLLWRFLPFKDFMKGAMILCIGILPIANEVYMNLTNVQWFSALGLILLFFDLKLRSIYDAAILSIAIILAGLTGPFSVMFLPLVVWKCWRMRREGLTLIPYLFAFGMGVVQLLFLYTHFQGRLFPNLPVPENHLWLMFYNAIKQTLLFDHRMIVEFRWRHWLVVGPAILVFVFSLINSLRKKKELEVLLLICLGLNIFFTVKANWPFEWLMSPFLEGMRYFFLPFILIFWYIVLQFNRIRWVQVGCILLILSLFLIHGKWVRSEFIDYKWKSEIAEYKEKGDLIVPINPPGWYVILKQK